MYKLENNVEWTTELKNAFKHGLTRGKIVYTDDNDNIVTINENNGIKNIKIYDEKNVVGLGFIGQATSRQVDIESIDIVNTINLENKEIEVFLGADYNNQTYYINYGKFVINQAPKNDITNGIVKITAFDYMIKTNIPYVPTITFPCTLEELTNDVCFQTGLILATTNFSNKDFIVDSNQFDGKSCREVLRHVGKCAFSWVRIGQDNKLYIDFEVNNTITETLTIDDYYRDKFKTANIMYGPINRVIYAESNIQGQEEKVEDVESIALNGLHELTIYDNYFAYTTEKRQELIQAGTKLFGLQYMPVQELQMTGCVYLDCNDIVGITDYNNNIIFTICLNHIIEYNGSVSDNLTSETESQTETTYKNTNKPISANALTEVVIDRALKQIQLLVQNIMNLVHTKNGINNIFIDDIPTGKNYITKFVVKGDTNYFDTTNITLVVSEGIKNEETVLISEDGDTLTTENENALLLEPKSLYIDKINIDLEEVLRSLTIDDITYYDELQILQDGTIQIIRRIGEVSGALYLLDKEIITKLEEKFVLPSNDKGYYYFIDEIDNLKYYTEYIINNEYSNTFSTIVQLQSELRMLENSINLNVSEKYQTIENAETIEREVKAELELKVDTDKLISEINASADIIRLIGQRLIIEMQNYSLDEEGNMSAKSGDIAGFLMNANKFSKSYSGTYNFTTQDVQILIGYLDGYNSLSNQLQTLYDVTEDNNLNVLDVVKMINIVNGNTDNPKTINAEVSINSNDSNKLIQITNTLGINPTRMGIFSLYCYLISADIIAMTNSTPSNFDGIMLDKVTRKITLSNGTNTTIITPTGITTPTVTQTSREEEKKNFELLENALDEVINTDIYKYHLNWQENTDKKHVGFIIGDNFKYSHLLTTEDSENKEIGVDTYSMISVLWRAVQEQQEQIQQLQKEIEILKGE